MKRILFYGILGVILWACKNETRDNTPLIGNYYTQGNPYKFYFVDEEGEDMLKLIPGAELPTTLFDFTKLTMSFVFPEDSDADNYYSYNNLCNSVGYDSEQGLNCWSTYIQGYEWVHDSEFYVRFNNTDMDTIRVYSDFVTDGCIGGNVCPVIQNVYYNGVQVIKNGDYIQGEGIWIKKSRKL